MCSDSPLDVIGEKVLLGGGADIGKIVTVGGEFHDEVLSMCTHPKRVLYILQVSFSNLLHFFIHMFIFLNVNFTSICSNLPSLSLCSVILP